MNVWNRSRVMVGLTAALLPALLASIAFQPPLAEAAELKVGYVNLAKVFDGYTKTQAYDAQLTQQGRQKEAELKSRLDDLQKMREQLEVMTPEAREAKARDLQAKADELKRFRSFTARDLQNERDEMAAEILKEIETAVQAFAKQQGYDIVLDDRSVLFAQPQFDFTEAILNHLNSQAGR